MARNITALANIIAAKTAEIETYLTENQQPPLSLDFNAPRRRDFPAHIVAAQTEILSATADLEDLILGPQGMLMNVRSKRPPLQFITRFRIYELVPLGGEVSYAELAKAIGVDVKATKVVMNAAIAYGVFAESKPGFIRHNAVSRLLKEDRDMADFVTAHVEEIWPNFFNLVRSLEKYPRADEPTKSAGALFLHPEGNLDFYSALAQQPERARRFGGAMSMFQKGPEYSAQHVVDGFDWQSLGKGATVVDLGGSHGDVGAAVTSALPELELRWVVQDKPDTISCVPDGIKVNNPTLQFMAHDFFLPQPVKGAAVYFIRWIFHNWPDQYAHRILRALIPALESGSKVVVMDGVQPKFGSLDTLTQRTVCNLDMSMLALGNSRERDAEEWKELFSEADSRFVFEGFTQPKGSRMTVMVVGWKG